MKTKSFAAHRGLKPFNWNRFLRLKRYTTKSLKAAEDLSGDWVTCACGNQCKDIPRGVMGVPLDDTLSNLGTVFCGDITEMGCAHLYDDKQGFKKARSDAKKTLEKIEKRSAFLIRTLSE